MTADTALLVFLAWLGLSIGSFLNVCIHRIPRHASVATPPSSCPNCGYTLRWYDNIPVASYVWLGGRCRNCLTSISVRYPIVEIVTMLVFVLHWYVFGWTPLLPVRLLLSCGLIVLFAIDLDYQLLPDVITLPGIALGLIASAFLPPGLVDAAIGAALGAGVLWLIATAYFRYAGHEGMGRGDFKMLAMIGAFLGWPQVLLTLALASVTGAIVGLALILMGRGRKYALPFGVFLALGALVASTVGDAVVAWYVDTALQ
jgi:leader peptidase (prepilin peptidase) / N-methyltransferase